MESDLAVQFSGDVQGPSGVEYYNSGRLSFYQDGDVFVSVPKQWEDDKPFEELKPVKDSVFIGTEDRRMLIEVAAVLVDGKPQIILAITTKREDQ